MNDGRLAHEFLNYACNKPFKLLVFNFYILIWNAFCLVVELPAIFTLNFCHVFLFNLSHKNFWTFSGRALELLATIFFSILLFHYFLIQNAHRVVRELLAVINLNLPQLREISEFYIDIEALYFFYLNFIVYF